MRYFFQSGFVPERHKSYGSQMRTAQIFVQHSLFSHCDSVAKIAPECEVKMKRKYILKMISIMMFYIIFGSTTTIYASGVYSDLGGWRTGSISVSKGDYVNIWENIISNSVSAWNDSKANVSISISPYSQNSLKVATYDEEWYGLTSKQRDSLGGYVTQFSIKINSRTIYDNANDFSNFAQSTIVHEFGHIFWLADNPDTTKSSIMKHTRNRNKLITPQEFDIKNVNAKYQN